MPCSAEAATRRRSHSLVLSVRYPAISSFTSFSKGEGTVLHIFNELYNYHIYFNSLFNIFEATEFSGSSKSEVCALMAFSFGEGRDEVSNVADMDRLFQLFHFLIIIIAGRNKFLRHIIGKASF